MRRYAGKNEEETDKIMVIPLPEASSSLSLWMKIIVQVLWFNFH